MRAFLLYIDDWLSSKKIALMDAAEERGFFRLLLTAATEPDCGLPNDDAQLAVFSKLGPQWFKATQTKELQIGTKTSGEKLRECFTEKDGRLYNERLLKEFNHQKEVQQRRAEAGRKGGTAKANAKQMLSNSQANAKQMDKQNPTNVRLGLGLSVSLNQEEKDSDTSPDIEDPTPESNVSEETVSALSAEEFSGETPYDWFSQNFIGELRSDSWRTFASCVNTPDLLAKMQANLRPWMGTKKYRNGYGQNSEFFLRGGCWHRPPGRELMAEDASPTSKSGSDDVKAYMNRMRMGCRKEKQGGTGSGY